MKTIISAAILASAFAAPALAWEGQVKACYNKVYVPTSYHTSKHLVMGAHTEWEYRNGQMIEVYYPAVYKEKKTVKTPGHYIAKKAACRVAN